MGIAYPTERRHAQGALRKLRVSGNETVLEFCIASLPSSSDIVDAYPSTISNSAIRTSNIEVDEISIYLVGLVQAVLVQGCVGVSERQVSVSVSRFTLKRSHLYRVEVAGHRLQFIHHRLDFRCGGGRAFPACLIGLKCFQTVLVRLGSIRCRLLCCGACHVPRSGASTQHSHSDNGHHGRVTAN